LPTDTSCDLRQPGPEGCGFAQLIEMAIGLEQGVDKHLFGIFPVAAHADHLPIDSILVLPG
jgi:hypothetical protein